MLHAATMYARDTALIATPIGIVRVIGSDDHIDAIRIEGADGSPTNVRGAAVQEAARQLHAWFAGTLRHFDLPLAASATTRGNALREAMIAINYGETASYGALARSIGSSARAIGQACARNPFPIIVPCHRVLNADGSLGAYSAGDGAATKIWLLEHERRIANRTLL